MSRLWTQPRCLLCNGAETTRAGQLCPSCREKLHPLTGEAAEFGLCRAPLRYRDEVRLAIHRFKFDGQTIYAEPFGRWMAGCVTQTPDVVCWVPCHFWRNWRRGYDQAKLLAAQVARQLGCPREGLLRKRRNPPSQSTLTGSEERGDNVRGAFAVKKTARVSGRRVLLIDDVCTSGATLQACKGLLLAAGAKSVECVVLAKT